MGFVNYGMLCSIMSSITDLCWGLYARLCAAIYMLVICALARVVDICQLLFRKFAGLDSIEMTTNGNSVYEGDIVLGFLNSSIVKNMFWACVVLAVVILLITTFVATIKTEFAQDGNNNKKKVIKNAFRGLANFLLVPLIAVFGIIVGNALLSAIDGATTISGGQTKISNQIFLVGAYNANRCRSSEDNTESGGVGTYLADSFATKILHAGATDSSFQEGYANFGVFCDDNSGINPSRAADKIDSFFGNNTTIDLIKVKTDETGNLYIINLVNKSQRTLRYDDSLDFWHGSANMVYADGASDLENDNRVYSDKITFSIYNTGLVYYYYDLTLLKFDYIIPTIALVFCGYVFVVTLLGLIKRLFMLITLFIISAPICALYPLDGGKALGGWRSNFIKETLSAYSAVVIMNIFLALLPLFMKINVFSSTSTNLDSGFAISILNYFARILIILGALVFFKDGAGTISGMIGTEDAFGKSADKSKNFKGNVTKALAGAALGAGAVKALGSIGAAGIGKAHNFNKDVKDMGFKNAMGMRKDAALDKAIGPVDENGKRHVAKGILSAPGRATHAMANGLQKAGQVVHSVSSPESKEGMVGGMRKAYGMFGKKSSGGKDAPKGKDGAGDKGTSSSSASENREKRINEYKQRQQAIEEYNKANNKSITMKDYERAVRRADREEAAQLKIDRKKAIKDDREKQKKIKEEQKKIKEKQKKIEEEQKQSQPRMSAEDKAEEKERKKAEIKKAKQDRRNAADELVKQQRSPGDTSKK